MKRTTLVSMLVISIVGIGTLLLTSGTVSAQNPINNTILPPYNPYPPGILPSDLASEIARVRREVASIESELSPSGWRYRLQF